MAKIASLAAMALKLPAFMARPLLVDQAREDLRRRMATREERFVASSRMLIFSNPRSPYARLLAWAGIDEVLLFLSV